MRPHRILIVIPDLPLPFGNAASRWFYVLVKGMHERGHKVTTFASVDQTKNIDLVKQLFPPDKFDIRYFERLLQKRCWSKLRTVRRPFSYVYSPHLENALLSEKKKGFDILHLEQLWSGWMGMDEPEKSLINIHYLYNIDLKDTQQANIYQRLFHTIILSTERRLISYFRTFRCLSERLSHEVKNNNSSANVHTVPLGIDLSKYIFIPSWNRPKIPTVSVIGNMDWLPTRTATERFLKRLWPRISQKIPHAKAIIVGRNAKKVFPDYYDSKVKIEENVPDIQPYFEQTGVLLYAPLRGSGMKVKVLEAMAFGVPVVTTWEGVEGLPARDGVHAGISNNDEELINKAVEFLSNSDLQNRVRKAARILVESHCCPENTLSGVEKIYSAMSKSNKLEKA